MKNRLLPSAAALLSCAGLAQAQFTQSFDDITTLAGAGFVQQNNSIPGLTNWFQGNLTVFVQQEGTGYLGTNFNNTTGTNTISNWMVTPVVPLQNGAVLTFWARTVNSPAFPDRLQVRMNKTNTGSNVGVAATDVGDFTDLLLDINPTYTTAGFPNTWTQYNVLVSGVTGTVNGRLAWRYFVEGGGPSGANSDYIGIDAAEYSLTAPNIGACCLPGFNCSIISQTACATQGGTFQGTGTACASCPQPPTGRCCLVTGACQQITSAACATAGGVYAGDNTTCGTCPQPWVESGDAGNTPGTAQVAAGSGSLPGITGNLSLDDSDMYKIKICDAANFVANTVSLTTIDTQLFLFKLDGTGVVMNDDHVQIGAEPLVLQSRITSVLVGPAGNGDYLLAISQWDKDPLGATTAAEIWADTPYRAERAPDGLAPTEAVGSWSVTTTAGGSYGISLAGACYVGGGCYANCDGSTGNPALTANDFQCFINKFAANDPYANCDGSTGNPALTANDFQCFINKYAGGCS